MTSEELFDNLELSQLHFVQHIYTHICVLDFEATCDREPGKVEKEVLAIPVVLLDAAYYIMLSMISLLSKQK